MTETEKRALNNFDKKIQELLSSRYLRSAKQTGIQYNFSWKKGVGVDQSRIAPDEDSIKAFLLTLRFFVQNNEPISIYNIAKIVDKSLVDEGLKLRFNSTRKELNLYLDNPSGVQVTFNNKVLTLREIFQTFLYGLYAHENDDKAKTLESWKMAGIHTLLRTEFDNVVIEILYMLSIMKTTTNRILELNA